MHTPRRLLHHLLVGSLGLLGSIGLGISGAHAMTANVSQTLDNVSVATDYEFEIELNAEPLIHNTGSGYRQNKLQISFPEEFNLYAVYNCYSSCINLNSSTDPNVTGINSFYVDPDANTIRIGFSYSNTESPSPANTDLNFTISSIIAPATANTHTLEVELLDGGDSSTISSANATVSTTSVLDASFEADDLTPGATGATYTVNFSIPNEHMVGRYAGIHFPKGTNLGSASVSLNNTDPSHNPFIQNVSIEATLENYLLVRFTSGATPTDGASTFSIDISGVQNSNTHPTSTLGVATYQFFFGYNGFNPIWGGGTAIQGGTPPATNIDNETATSNNYTLATTDNTYTVSFDYAGDLDSTNSIVLTFPAEISLSNVTNPDITLSGQTLTKGAATVVGQVVTIPVASGNLSTDRVTITLEGVDNPTLQGGLYSIGIQILDDTSTVIASGTASINFGSMVQVSALVAEALILTLGSNAVTLNADPLVEDGRDASQYTELTVFSNSRSGYALSALLPGGRLLHSGGLGEIPTGTGDGTFGYHATNAPHDPNHTFTGDQEFPSTTSSELLSRVGGVDTVVGHDDVADPVRHTVYYDLDVNFLTPAGTYTGLIYYTVTAAF